MDVKEIRKTVRYFEESILELLRELETKTDVYVQYVEFERHEARPGGVGAIGAVKVTVGLEEG